MVAQRFACRYSRTQYAGVGVDSECTILAIAAGQHGKRAGSVSLGKLSLVPRRRNAAFTRDDPDLEQPTQTVPQIMFAVCHAGACTHHLHIACFGAAQIAHAVAVGDRTFADISDDFHIVVRVRREAGLRGNLVVVPHADIAPVHAAGVIVRGKGEMMVGLQPAMIGLAKRGEGAVLNHQPRTGCNFGHWIFRIGGDVDRRDWSGDREQSGAFKSGGGRARR